VERFSVGEYDRGSTASPALFGNRLQRARSLFWNLKNAPKAVRKNVIAYRKVAEADFRPQMVVSDFESWAALYALSHRIPVVSIDNIQAVNRLKHGKARDSTSSSPLAVRMKVPRAYHYLVTSFFPGCARGTPPWCRRS
jgi:hypothetical protein